MTTSIENRPHTLTMLPLILRKHHGVEVKYRQVYGYAVDGRLPGVARLNNRWVYWDADVPALAAAITEILGLNRTAAA